MWCAVQLCNRLFPTFQPCATCAVTCTYSKSKNALLVSFRSKQRLLRLLVGAMVARIAYLTANNLFYLDCLEFGAKCTLMCKRRILSRAFKSRRAKIWSSTSGSERMKSIKRNEVYIPRLSHCLRVSKACQMFAVSLVLIERGATQGNSKIWGENWVFATIWSLCVELGNCIIAYTYSKVTHFQEFVQIVYHYYFRVRIPACERPYRQPGITLCF